MTEPTKTLLSRSE